MSLTALFVKRPTLIFVTVALALLAGVLAWQKLVRQEYPNIALPAVTISVTDAGASTRVMRDTIVRPILNQLGGTPHLQSTSALIQNGQASVTASFALSSSVDADLSNVEKAYQSAQANLPPNLVPPAIFASNPSQIAVIHFAVSSQRLDAVDLAQIVTGRLVPQIEQVSGVSKVDVVGDVTPAYAVRVDPAPLLADGYTINDVVATLRANNLRAPGGFAYEPNRQTAIDVQANITSAAEIAALPLQRSGAPNTSSSGAGSGGGGSTTLLATGAGALAPTTGSVGALYPWTVPTSIVRVGQIASIAKAYKPRLTFAYSGGHQVVLLDVKKTTGASEVTVSNNVQAALPALRKQFPQITFTTLEVQSNLTKRALAGVIHTLIESIALTALVMILFLQSWRNAVIVMVAIPTSLGVALFAMHVLNLTLDTISLLAMTLVIGILIDDSTVVLENVERHHAELGEDPQAAAIRGRGEIGTAAVVLTLVDVVVFLPIALLSGPIGRELSEFGIVVTVSTLTSLFMSFTITPGLAGRWGLLSTWRPPGFIRAFSTAVDGIEAWYRDRVLPWSLGHAWVIVGIAALSFGGAMLLLPLGAVGKAYIPPADRGEIFVQFNYAPGTPLLSTRAGILPIERIVDRIPDLRSESTSVGGFDAPYGGFVQAPSFGEIHVFLTSSRTHSTNYWVRDLQRVVAQHAPGARALVIPANGTQGGQVQPIDEIVSLHGGGSPVRAARRVLAALRATPGAVDVTSSASELAPLVDVRFNRAKARALNASIGSAATAIQAAFGGATATQIQTRLGVVYVDVIYPVSRRRELPAILAIPLRTASGGIIRVGDIASLTSSPEPPLITEENRVEVVHVDGNVSAGYSLSAVQQSFNARIAALHLPASVIVKPTANGQQQHLSDVLHSVGFSLLLSIVLVYLLMVALYNSYISPFIILFAVPVATVGALGALWLTHETLNLFSLIGSILLVGLVTKNGILVVDYANTLQRDGRDKRTAILEGAATRLRPILMTTVAMIVGLLPLALALERSDAVRRSLGTVVIGGMTSSLLLTLVLVPVIYQWFAPTIAPTGDTTAEPRKQERSRQPRAEGAG